jgi:spermidine synthase
MKPNVKIAETRAPDGSPMVLYRHDDEFIIRVDSQDLMLSRAHESELELARLGCERLAAKPDAVVLVGGLGMGYTLRQALDVLPPTGRVIVSELVPEVIRWNQDYLGELADHPLRDPRVEVRTGDVVELIRTSPGAFDAVLLDVDNGPNAMTDISNDRLYSAEGIRSCIESLRPGGCLAVWSSMDDDGYERRLRQEGLEVRLRRVPLYKGARTFHGWIWTGVKAGS